MARSKSFMLQVVEHFNENRSTVRATAKHFDVSKSSVYNYITKKFPNPISEEILSYNKSVRHIRGGQATRERYKNLSL